MFYEMISCLLREGTPCNTEGTHCVREEYTISNDMVLAGILLLGPSTERP